MKIIVFWILKLIYFGKWEEKKEAIDIQMQAVRTAEKATAEGFIAPEDEKEILGKLHEAWNKMNE